MSLIAALVLAAAVAPPACPTHEQGGVVVAYEASAGPPGRRPFVNGRHGSFTPAAGQALCRGDSIVNPPGSGIQLQVRLAGGRRRAVPPGSVVDVPAPTAWTSGQDALERFERMFGATATESHSATRGDEGWRAMAPPPGTVFAVAAWGPLTLGWPGGAVAGPWTVVLREGELTRSLRAAGPLVRIDLFRDCPRGCRVSVLGPDGGERMSTNVRLVEEAEAPRPPWISAGRLGPSDLALEGGWLLRGHPDPGWAAEGASMLWTSACGYPGLTGIVEQLYRLRAPADPCAEPADFRPGGP
jgi:hypothetical protein